MKIKLIKKIKSYIPSKYLREALARGGKELAEGKTKFFTNVKDLLKSLNSPD